MKRLRRLRRLTGWGILAAALAASGSPHTHSLLTEVLQPGEAGRAESQRAVTRHNPLSRAVHCHAVLRLIDDGCVACHAQRTTVSRPSSGPGTCIAGRARFVLPVFVSPRSGSPLPKSSRAPPTLLV